MTSTLTLSDHLELRVEIERLEARELDVTVSFDVASDFADVFDVK